MNKRRNRQLATIAGALVGLIIIVTFVISLLAPDLGRSSSSSSYPTYTPFGTPPPPTEVIIPTPELNPQLGGNLPYIHTSGFFQTFLPAGDDWIVNEGGAPASGTFARVVIQSPSRLVVIHNYIQGGVEYESLDALSSDLLTAQHFAEAWADYDSWQETGRTITPENVIARFDLISDNHDYLGRSLAHVENGWLFVARIVVPANNPQLADLLEKYVAATFHGFPEMLVLPQPWPAYIDQQSGFIFKYPNGGQQIAGAAGRPATFSLFDEQGNHLVRIWTEPNLPLTSADAASAWVNDNIAEATASGAEPVTRGSGTGFEVAYSYRDTAGDPHSGLAVLLNDDTGTLFIANLQIDPPGINLLDASAVSDQLSANRRAVTDGFIVLPDSARQPVTLSDTQN